MEEAPIVFSPIRGIRFRGHDAVLRALRLNTGDPMIVEREPHNPSDSNAIKLIDVYDQDADFHIGYIAAEKAAVMAPWMDKGWMYTARVMSPAKIKKGVVILAKLKVICKPIKPASVKVSRKVHAHVDE